MLVSLHLSTCDFLPGNEIGEFTFKQLRRLLKLTIVARP